MNFEGHLCRRNSIRFLGPFPVINSMTFDRYNLHLYLGVCLSESGEIIVVDDDAGDIVYEMRTCTVFA